MSTQVAIKETESNSSGGIQFQMSLSGATEAVLLQLKAIYAEIQIKYQTQLQDQLTDLGTAMSSMKDAFKNAAVHAAKVMKGQAIAGMIGSGATILGGVSCMGLAIGGSGSSELTHAQEYREKLDNPGMIERNAHSPANNVDLPSRRSSASELSRTNAASDSQMSSNDRELHSSSQPDSSNTTRKRVRVSLEEEEVSGSNMNPELSAAPAAEATAPTTTLEQLENEEAATTTTTTTTAAPAPAPADEENEPEQPENEEAAAAAEASARTQPKNTPKIGPRNKDESDKVERLLNRENFGTKITDEDKATIDLLRSDDERNQFRTNLDRYIDNKSAEIQGARQSKMQLINVMAPALGQVGSGIYNMRYTAKQEVKKGEQDANAQLAQSAASRFDSMKSTTQDKQNSNAQNMQGIDSILEQLTQANAYRG